MPTAIITDSGRVIPWHRVYEICAQILPADPVDYDEARRVRASIVFEGGDETIDLGFVAEPTEAAAEAAASRMFLRWVANAMRFPIVAGQSVKDQILDVPVVAPDDTFTTSLGCEPMAA